LDNRNDDVDESVDEGVGDMIDNDEDDEALDVLRRRLLGLNGGLL
jgi:hypothetical protein